MQKRPGTKLIYAGEPSDKVKALKDGRFIVARKNKLPMVITKDGNAEELTRENHPDIWQQFEAAMNALLRPH